MSNHCPPHCCSPLHYGCHHKWNFHWHHWHHYHVGFMIGIFGIIVIVFIVIVAHTTTAVTNSTVIGRG